jgi:hypothetical protein
MREERNSGIPEKDWIEGGQEKPPQTHAGAGAKNGRGTRGEEASTKGLKL